MKITFTSTFHNTEASCYFQKGKPYLTSRQITQANNKLCGIKDCMCRGIHSSTSSLKWEPHVLGYIKILF